ncbi:hypothetical protein PFLA_a0319 [Pseudoalteromonas flavipulchra NCIMB 2033 = ATCC BAA-314]|nr:hypothetical protein [Pseudoalteromonas flavipulchra NCIMB 2033 = ATCC BAA-314]
METKLFYIFWVQKSIGVKQNDNNLLLLCVLIKPNFLLFVG